MIHVIGRLLDRSLYMMSLGTMRYRGGEKSPPSVLGVSGQNIDNDSKIRSIIKLTIYR